LSETKFDKKKQHIIGNVRFNTKPKKLSRQNVRDLEEKISMSSEFFVSAMKISNCLFKGIFIESHKNNILSDNSLIMLKENFFARVIKILIIRNDVYLVLEVEYKIVDKKTHSQYYKLEKLANKKYYIRKIDNVKDKVIFNDNRLYFVIPPNSVECD
jgi:hypothetical protein